MILLPTTWPSKLINSTCYRMALAFYLHQRRWRTTLAMPCHGDWFLGNFFSWSLSRNNHCKLRYPAYDAHPKFSCEMLKIVFLFQTTLPQRHGARRTSHNAPACMQTLDSWSTDRFSRYRTYIYITQKDSHKQVCSIRDHIPMLKLSILSTKRKSVHLRFFFSLQR